MRVRTRFAPSPTGYLHVGGARTALYSWLYARKHQGTFILRIEDTDLERSTPESVQAILDGMQWLGLDYDEGPFYQTQRFGRYQQVIAQLVSQGAAYQCYCTKERLDALREQQMANKEKPKYDGLCRHRQDRPDLPYVIRFANPESGVVCIQDSIKGDIQINNQELDDLVLARTDGSPTYNLSVVVDDWDMAVTHVIRGDDHVNNTPRQINILSALGAELPVYGHVPMILGDDGQRLSKRHGAVSVLQYRDEGYLPQALLNYLVRLGWSHGDQEIFSREEMIALFDPSDVNRAPSAFNTDKLNWVNQQYIKSLAADAIAPHLAWQFEALDIDLSQGPALTDLIEAQRDRAKTLKEMALSSLYFYQPVTAYDDKAVAKQVNAQTADILQALHEGLQQTPWQTQALHDAIAQTVNQLGIGFGKLGMPLRLALTGGTSSPALEVTLQLLGRERSLQRITDFVSGVCK